MGELMGPMGFTILLDISVGFLLHHFSGDEIFEDFYQPNQLWDFAQGETRDMQLGANGFQGSKIGAVLSFLVSAT